jgi:hypothetical protein
MTTKLKCLTRQDLDIDNMAYQDAFAYHEAYDTILSVCTDLKQEVINNQIVICQSDSVIKAKDDHIAFKTSQADMLAKDNQKLTKWNTFWRTLAGSAIFVAAVEIIKDLR